MSSISFFQFHHNDLILPRKRNNAIVGFNLDFTPFLRYMSPEYFMHGIINEKTDVFAYGVLLLELVTGRKAVDSSRQSLVIWVIKANL